MAVSDVDFFPFLFTIHLRLFKYDAELKWPSVMTLRLTLLQSNPGRHFETTWTVSPVTDKFYGIFGEEFYYSIRDSELKQYLRDDMLSIIRTG